MKTSKTQQIPDLLNRAAGWLSVKSITLLTLFQILTCFAFAQATMTGNSSGNNWAVAANWSGSNIGDVVTETVTINTNIDPKIYSGSTFTVGSTTISNNNTLTINSGGTLNIGDATHTATLTTNSNMNINVAGTLIIWGTVNVNSNINWSISGTVIIKGNLVMASNANVTVSGNLQIDGNLQGSSNTNVSVSGNVKVGGNINVGGGSNASACASCFTRGGTCTGPASFCGNTTLPVKLIEFAGEAVATGNNIHWVTSMERNFDYFELERAGKDLVFETIGTIKGKGGLDITTSYQFIDTNPLAGNNYYRLKSVDLDNSYEHSDLIHVEWNGSATGAILYPTIVTKYFTVDLKDELSTSANLVMIDAVGNAMYKTQLSSSLSTIEVPDYIKPGAYLVKIATSAGQRTIRILKK
ncbi:MAG TPA: T9SS type A sorting domain-containing protein [Ohtaekwangia sp.]|uniref:T9SS type A sorting domain-containing protein n=1 Tax=Ohtaekwangia sp. TaxID=2066019 RepID=UPI002F937D6A